MPCVCLLSRFVKDFGPARVIGSLQFGSVGFLLGAQGFPGGTSRKEPANAADVIDAGSTPGWGGPPGGGHGNPLQCACLKKSHGWRNLAGYSPWGRKELDTTEASSYTCFSPNENVLCLVAQPCPTLQTESTNFLSSFFNYSHHKAFC